MKMKYWAGLVVIILTTSQLLGQTKISSRLKTQINQASNSSLPVRALILLKDQTDISGMNTVLSAEKAGPARRALTVVSRLKKIARKSQGPLISALKNEYSATVFTYKSFWITNIIEVQALPVALLEISRRSDVKFIDSDRRIVIDSPVFSGVTSGRSIAGAEPGLKVINSPAMWRKGFTGKGVIVMNIDSGVDGTHPALSSRWRGNDAGVPSTAAWFDPDSSRFPHDQQSSPINSHGTHLMGIIAGLDTATHDTIGVAFGAKWIAARTVTAAGNFTSNNIAAFQWALNPDGDTTTVDDMPAVINCSWRDVEITPEMECDSVLDPYIGIVNAVESAGIAVVFSAGNQGGQGTASITPPKNVNVNEVSFWATGAIDAGDPAFPIGEFSSRGPVIPQCQTGIPSLDIKPEVVAPGVQVRSSVVGGYAEKTGSSLAAAHVAGAIALLKQVHPNKTGHELKMALYKTAKDLGEPGEDNSYGRGLIDVYAAHYALEEPFDPRPVSGLTAYSNYLTPYSVRLNWIDPAMLENGDSVSPGELTIRIQRDGISVGSVNGGVEEFIDAGLNDGQLYQYQVSVRVTSTDSISLPAEASWTAGGAGQPKPPRGFCLSPAPKGKQHAFWQNPSENIDGTPLDDFAGLKLLEDDSLLTTFTRSPADTGKMDSSDFTVSPGDHKYYIKVFDNENPVFESLPGNVSYTPILLSDTLTFDTLFVGQNSTRKLKIRFSGRDTLEVREIVLSDSTFSMDTSRFFLATGDSLELGVNFHPPAAGVFTAGMRLFIPNEILPVDSVLLTGTALEPPRIEVNPIDINRSMNEGDSTDVRVNISNTGKSELNWQAQISSVSRSGSSVGEEKWKSALRKTGLRKKANQSASLVPPDFIKLLPPANGVVDTGRVADLWIRLYGQTLVSDTQRALVNISSNDPHSPLVSVAVRLEVLSAIGALTEVPATWGLEKNYPNPFNPSTTIQFQVPVISDVKINVYNILGKLISQLVDEKFTPGQYQVSWDGRDQWGEQAASGVYFYWLETPQFSSVKKMLLLR